MKRMMYTLVAWATMVGLLLLPGCGMKSPDEIAAGNQVEVLHSVDGETLTTYKGNTYATATMEKMTAMCYENRAEIEKYRVKAIAELEGLQQTMAVMHRDTMDMIASVWGKKECEPGTNEFDATIAYYKEQNAFRTEVVRTVSGGVMGIMKWGGLAYVGGKIADNMGNGDRIGGDQTTVQAGGDQEISESTFSHSRTDTESHSTLSQSQITGAGDQRIDPATNSQTNNAMPAGEEVGEAGTEEYCNSLGMTLRESTGACITWEYKEQLEAAAAAE